MDFASCVDHLYETLGLKVDLCTWREVTGSLCNIAVDSTERGECLFDS